MSPISLEPAFWATLPLYSTVDCTVGGSKESRGSTVTLYVYPAAACGGYVGASSSRVAFRAIGVEVSCSVAAGLAGCRAGVGRRGVAPDVRQGLLCPVL